jgi:type I pantothenate kinase
MDQRVQNQVSPHRTFARAAWAALRADTPMTLTSDEVVRLQSLNDRIDIAEVEEIYLPLSRMLSLYVRATQNLFRAQQGFLGTEDANCFGLRS